MNDNFDAFKRELEELCVKYGVVITTSRYADDLQVWPTIDGREEIHDAVESMRDRT